MLYKRKLKKNFGLKVSELNSKVAVFVKLSFDIFLIIDMI